ncbi:IS66 family transposase [Flammeovirga aprica]|uniref:IS66 family transposase n=1 Tax=Flammeovirga aprica JL-4 TaxID=694437 RepID=A0A7X9S270_9BACT|nr:IS66 family transposase [Flammeovirga aprica]NME72998.1 IS66 family transposase [Flammeovirga aprica JL-4]
MTDKEKIEQLESQVKDLTEKLAMALKLLEQKSIQKDSSNSSKPPSQDSFKKRTASLRKKSTKKSGGQPGHKGSSLKMSSTPDEIISLRPSYCTKCGQSISSENLIFKSKRQVVDLPSITPFVKEYHQYEAQCQCGCHQEAHYPNNVSNHIQYGENIEALIGYLSVAQYLPYNRIKSLFKDAFSLHLSEGTIDNKLNSLYKKALPYHSKLREKLEKSTKPVGADETSCRVNGDNFWSWVWQNEDYCYITISNNRGSATIDQHFPNGFPCATLSSDRWAAQLKTKAKKHQICIAHILRELNYLEAAEKHSFTIHLRELLHRAIQLKREVDVSKYGDHSTQKLENELNVLLQETIPNDSCDKTAKLQRSLIKHREAVFPFLYEQKLSFENNASERAIRNVKLKMKVSGMFKTGYPIYAVLKSMTETLKKKGESILEAFITLASLKIPIAE